MDDARAPVAFASPRRLRAAGSGAGGGGEAGEMGGVGLEVDALGGDPAVVVIGVEVAVAGVADDRDDAAVLARGAHGGDLLQRRPQRGARGPAHDLAELGGEE